MTWPDCPYPGCKREATYTNPTADAITCKQHSWCHAEMLVLTEEHELKMAHEQPGMEPCDLCIVYSRCWVTIGSGRDKRTDCDRCTEKINNAW